MKVFVAGATGVVGRRAVARLVAAGAEVTGLARSEEKQAALYALGATPAQVSLFDRGALAATVAGHDVVVNLATSIPTGERSADLAAWNDNHRIRHEGARNLVDAALEGGADRYVQESIALLYGDGGDRVLDESAPVDPTAVTGAALEAEAQAARFAAQGGTGFFYGADSAHTVAAVAAARAGQPFELGPDAAYRPAVTTDDAAAATVAALDAPSGVYNVADDRPLRREEHVAALAAALGGAPLPPPVTPDLPPDLSMMLRSQRISHELFTSVTGWHPRFPSAWEGWPFVLAAMRTQR
jgi:nucleoside-diphosphate-sugar epimerase